MITELSRLHPDLEGVILIQGTGLTSNVYVILGRWITLIDTGSGPPDNFLLSQLEKLKIDINKINTIIITHAHSDHIGGLVDFISIKDLVVKIHPLGADLILKDLRIEPLMNNKPIKAGHLTLKTIYTPGHSSDSLCLYNPAGQILFSGDTVFPNGNFGRTDLPTGDERKMHDSLKRLSEIPIKHLLAGHEQPIVGDGFIHLKASLKSAELLIQD